MEHQVLLGGKSAHADKILFFSYMFLAVSAHYTLL